MKALLLALLFSVLPVMALAVNDSGFGTACPSGSTVNPGERICFDMNSAVSPASWAFSVQATQALACLKTDFDQEGVSATGGSPVTAIVRYCPSGDTSLAANCGIQACTTAGCTLTGLNGVPASQLACVVLGRGTYRVDFPTVPDGADVGLFTVQGSD